MTVTLTYKNGYVDDCDDASVYAENESGLVASIASDGDIATITGVCDNAADEYAYYEVDLTDISTTTYPTIKVKWKTSAASNGLQAKIWVVYGDASEDQYTLGFSTSWTVTTITLDTAKTLDKIRLVADDNPDTLAAGTFYVYYDWIIACAGTFTFPHVAPGGVKVKYLMKKAELQMPGREGNVSQRFGMDSPKISLSGDVLQGETWEASASDPHFDYLIRGLLIDEWCWLECTHPRIKAQVMYDNFTTSVETRGDKAVFTWQLDLTLHKLASYLDQADWNWMYVA